MTDLAQFLRARYTERRAVAEAAAPWPWKVNPDDAEEVLARDGILVADVFALSSNQTRNTATFIAANDPADVLADLDAKLALCDAYAPKAAEPRTDAELHADEEHPAWEYRSMEGNWTPRDGWESNVDCNGGYQVAGYTELSYWRRQLPAGQERPLRPEPLVLRILAQPFAEHPDYPNTP